MTPDVDEAVHKRLTAFGYLVVRKKLERRNDWFNNEEMWKYTLDIEHSVGFHQLSSSNQIAALTTARDAVAEELALNGFVGQLIVRTEHTSCECMIEPVGDDGHTMISGRMHRYSMTPEQVVELIAETRKAFDED